MRGSTLAFFPGQCKRQPDISHSCQDLCRELVNKGLTEALLMCWGLKGPVLMHRTVGLPQKSQLRAFGSFFGGSCWHILDCNKQLTTIGVLRLVWLEKVHSIYEGYRFFPEGHLCSMRTRQDLPSSLCVRFRGKLVMAIDVYRLECGRIPRPSNGVDSC